MSESIRYRIVGAIVFMALAVIFVPIFLDGSGRKEVTTVNIDKPSETEFIFSQTPQSDEISKEVKQYSAVDSVPHEEKKSDAPPEDKSVEEQKAPVVSEVKVSSDVDPKLTAWVVQVAALSEKEKAIELRDQLVEKKFDAFVEHGSVNSKDIYRVKVGPVLQEDAAKTLLAKIENQIKLSGMIVKQHPESAE